MRSSPGPVALAGRTGWLLRPFPGDDFGVGWPGGLLADDGGDGRANQPQARQAEGGEAEGPDPRIACEAGDHEPDVGGETDQEGPSHPAGQGAATTRVVDEDRRHRRSAHGM